MDYPDPTDPLVLAWADAICDRLSAAYQFQHSSVFLFDPAAESLRLVGQRWGAGDDLGLVRPGEWLVPLSGSICGRVFRTGRPALVADVALDPEFRSYPGARTRSEVAVPIVVADRVVGVINIESPRVGHYGIVDLDRLEAVAREAAATLPRPRPAGAER